VIMLAAGERRKIVGADFLYLRGTTEQDAFLHLGQQRLADQPWPSSEGVG